MPPILPALAPRSGDTNIGALQALQKCARCSSREASASRSCRDVDQDLAHGAGFHGGVRVGGSLEWKAVQR